MSNLLPLNTRVKVMVESHYGKPGNVVGHAVEPDDKGLPEAYNVVHIEHAHGVDTLLCLASDLKLLPYDPNIWAKHCWAKPEGK